VARPVEDTEEVWPPNRTVLFEDEMYKLNKPKTTVDNVDFA